MKIVYIPDEHICDGLARVIPSSGGWWMPSGDHLDNVRDGTVRQCSCGRTWVAGHASGLVPAIWRREGWWERRRRQRRTDRAAQMGPDAIRSDGDGPGAVVSG